MWWKRMKYKESFAARPEGQNMKILCNYAVIAIKGAAFKTIQPLDVRSVRCFYANQGRCVSTETLRSKLW